MDPKNNSEFGVRRTGGGVLRLNEGKAAEG